jgi:hypothetical protein
MPAISRRAFFGYAAASAVTSSTAFAQPKPPSDAEIIAASRLAVAVQTCLADEVDANLPLYAVVRQSIKQSDFEARVADPAKPLAKEYYDALIAWGDMAIKLVSKGMLNTTGAEVVQFQTLSAQLDKITKQVLPYFDRQGIANIPMAYGDDPRIEPAFDPIFLAISEMRKTAYPVAQAEKFNEGGKLSVPQQALMDGKEFKAFCNNAGVQSLAAIVILQADKDFFALSATSADLHRQTQLAIFSALNRGLADVDVTRLPGAFQKFFDQEDANLDAANKRAVALGLAQPFSVTHNLRKTNYFEGLVERAGIEKAETLGL